MKVIFFNGPPRSGKDYAGDVLRSLCPAARVVKFAGVLKERTHGLYGICRGGRVVPHDYFEERKDERMDEFMGLTPRQAYIAVSEDFMKPRHGQAVFGELLAKELSQAAYDACPVVAVTDSGFVEEAATIVQHVGPKQCRLVQIEKPGCSFQGDSRGYIDLTPMGVPTSRIRNDGTSNFIDSLILQLYDVLPAQDSQRQQ